ncbi:MAG: hypothetical protein RIR97_1157 [Pseudomonadota bacterium]|jgi:hypothetical protein
MKVKPIPYEKRTVFPSTGTGDLGFITEEIAATINVRAGPIKLLNGVEGRAGGFGRRHIEAHASRMKQIYGLGYKDVITYVQNVVASFDRIATQENGRILILSYKNNLHHHVICQWDDDISAWSVTTAIPKSTVRNANIVWERK